MIGNVVTAFTGIPTPPSINVEYLVVAGGGGAGENPNANQGGGGGGAGAYRTATLTGLSLSTNYTVTVGAGGAGGVNAAGSTGNDSVFSTVTSTKGGKGGRAGTSGSALNGGSGGGGGAGSFGAPNTGGTGTTGGNNGGDAANQDASGGGGKVGLTQALELVGIPGVAERTHFHGRTDTALVKEFFLGNGLQGRSWDVRHFLDAYVFLLDQRMKEHPGEVCPGVPEFLRSLRSLPEPPALGLLTGNIQLGARIKLGAHGLWGDWACGAFADDHEDRNQLAQIGRAHV